MASGVKPNVKFVKSLISHGSEYIDTGITVDNTTEIHASMLIKEWNYFWEDLFGIQADASSTVNLGRHGNTNNILIDYKGSKGRQVIPFNPPSSIDVEIDCRNNTIIFNGLQEPLIGKNDNIIEKTMILFSQRKPNGEIGSVPGAFALYNFSISKSGQKILDLAPALNESDEPCLYDRVSDTFYCNIGRGTFGYEPYEGEIING